MVGGISGFVNDEKRIENLADLNEVACKDLILSIIYTMKGGSVAFCLVKKCKAVQYPEGNHKLAWDCFVAKYVIKQCPCC